jgi:hypothetical protein
MVKCGVLFEVRTELLNIVLDEHRLQTIRLYVAAYQRKGVEYVLLYAL